MSEGVKIGDSEAAEADFAGVVDFPVVTGVGVVVAEDPVVEEGSGADSIRPTSCGGLTPTATALWILVRRKVEPEGFWSE